MNSSDRRNLRRTTIAESVWLHYYSYQGKFYTILAIKYDMQEEVLLTISNRIKEIRLAKKITAERLAKNAKVSKGLISQIENNRTVPSLPVLINILQALEVDLNDFFKNISFERESRKTVELKKPNEYKTFQKEHVKGFLYHRIFTRSILDNAVDFVLLELKEGARRKKKIVTESFEFNYMLKGKLECEVGDETYFFSEDESMFFDSRIEHNLANIGEGDAVMLIVYFFIKPDMK